MKVYLENGDFIDFDDPKTIAYSGTYVYQAGDFRKIWGNFASDLWSLCKHRKQFKCTGVKYAIMLATDFTDYLYGKAPPGVFFRNMKIWHAEKRATPMIFLCIYENAPRNRKTLAKAIGAVLVWSWSLMREPNEAATQLLLEGARLLSKTRSVEKKVRWLIRYVKRGGHLADLVPEEAWDCFRKHGVMNAERYLDFATRMLRLAKI